jgi:ribosomal protein S18 acetylase RimI-like enzyme
LQEILDYLKKNEYENVYIIRGLLYNIGDFRYEIIYDENNRINGMIAIWEEEKGAILRGSKALCNKWFNKLYGQYNFYELEEYFAEEKLTEFHEEIPKDSVTYNLIMAYSPEKQCIHEGFIEYKKIDKAEWYKMTKIFKERYGKDFIEFEPNNMEWLCVYQEEEAIATICLEKVDKDLVVISSFYVIPNMRERGVGTKLLKSVLRDYGDRRLMLFVHSENIKAMKLYEKLGFKDYKRVVNIEI